MSPLQIPGGIEILIIFLVLLFTLGVIAAVVMGIFYLSRRMTGDDEADIEALRDRVAELEAQVEGLRDTDDDR